MHTCKHTCIYVHNWSLQPLSLAYDLASQAIYAVCVNFMHEWPTSIDF